MATGVLLEGKDPKAALDTVASKYKVEVVPAYRAGWAAVTGIPAVSARAHLCAAAPARAA
jgi:hypothetical protein